MATATRNWFRRNRTAIAVGASVLGTAYFAGNYVLNKINEARQRMSEDRVAKENLRRRFAQNQEDCTYTVLALLPTAAENCVKAIPTEEILDELQARKSEKLARSTASSEIAPSEAPSSSVVDEDNQSLASGSYVHASQVTRHGDSEGHAVHAHRSKVQLWDDLKISSITRAFTLLYTLALLNLFTRIQLNLLGRRNYLSSVISLASPQQEGLPINLENRDDDNLDQEYGNDFETNRKYLTFSWWLLHRGWELVQERVEHAVKEVFGSLSPSESISLEKLAKLTLQIRENVEGATEDERRNRQWLPYLLPPKADEGLILSHSGVGATNDPSNSSTHHVEVSPPLRRLLDETSDLIDSPAFTHVLTLTLDAGFSLLVDSKIATQAYRLSVNPAQDDSSPTIPDSRGSEELGLKQRKATTKLARVLAVLTRQAHSIASSGDMNRLVDQEFGSAPNIPITSIKGANEYLAVLESVRDLEAFAAVVYSSNFELETAGVTASTSITNEFDKQEELRPTDVRQGQSLNAPDVQHALEHAWGKASAGES